MLVFSKTSQQRERISLQIPRAIYFNDEILVSFCNRGRVMETSAADKAFFHDRAVRRREAGHRAAD